MHRIFILPLLLIILPFSLKAQILPKDKSVLNYRVIGFTFPLKDKALNYTLEIASGHYDAEDSFKKNIINTVHNSTNKIIAEVPSFGSQYTWRVVYNFGEDGKTA